MIPIVPCHEWTLRCFVRSSVGMGSPSGERFVRARKAEPNCVTGRINSAEAVTIPGAGGCRDRLSYNGSPLRPSPLHM